MGDLFAPAHLLVILVIAVFIFGPSKLPGLGKDLGKSIREFKKAVSEPDDPAPVAVPVRRDAAPAPVSGDAPAESGAEAVPPRTLG
ncbi:MAG: twin-arginine translocase TatA/TatE family subunit [Thermodesulfobacteriota bacterium]